MKIKLLSLFPALLLYLNLNSQVPQVYNIEDCIRTGLERNFSLLISRNNETIARNNFTPGNAGFLPSVDLTGRHTGTLNNTRRELTDGTVTRTEGDFTTTSSAGISAGMTIFNGFNVQTTYKKLNELKQIGEFNTQLSVENLVADIISGYYNYIQQIELLTTMEYAVLLSGERLRIDEERYLLGSSSKLQVLQSRVYLNSDSSRLTKQNEIVRASRIRLNELMALEDLAYDFTVADTSILVNPSLLYEKILDETLQNNTSLKIASGNMALSEYDYKLITSRSYPYLNASGAYNYSFNTYSSGNASNQTGSGMNYGLTFGLNVFDGLNQRRSINNSVIDMRNKELRYQEIEQGIRADLITLYYAYQNYLNLITLENQNLQTATENFGIAMEMYRLGSLSGLDLREVQKSLLDARERLFSIEYQAKLAEISLKLISGGIMDYYR
jgi:outer membrane protein TolC